MVDLLLSYREVIPDQTNPQIWKDINLNTGLFILRLCQNVCGYIYQRFFFICFGEHRSNAKYIARY